MRCGWWKLGLVTAVVSVIQSRCGVCQVYESLSAVLIVRHDLCVEHIGPVAPIHETVYRSCLVTSPCHVSMLCRSPYE